jgi:two-component system NtrC family sensor kinase
LATIGQLAAGIAHEINEPLGNILGFAGLAKKCPDLPTGVQADLEKITTAALHAREIIRKMLLFARQMPPQKTLVNLNALVEEGLHFFEARCLKEGIQMIRSLDPDLPLIAADPAQMNQVLVNLVVNALQAMPKGGKLRIETFSQGEAVVLAVEDSGVGIPPEHLGKIFTPFFTTKEVGQGTGLGLPVVHGIVSSHGGRIQVESQPGRGTRLEIHLPRAKGGENSGKAENEIGHAARTNPGR